MKARGKREARRPWTVNQIKASSPEKGGIIISAFQASAFFGGSLPGATRFALAPGFHIPRLWRCLRKSITSGTSRRVLPYSRQFS